MILNDGLCACGHPARAGPCWAMIRRGSKESILINLEHVLFEAGEAGNLDHRHSRQVLARPCAVLRSVRFHLISIPFLLEALTASVVPEDGPVPTNVAAVLAAQAMGFGREEGPSSHRFRLFRVKLLSFRNSFEGAPPGVTRTPRANRTQNR